MAGNPLAQGGLQNNVVSDKEDAKRKGKKTKKMIRVAGGQVIIIIFFFSILPSPQLGVGRPEPFELGQQ